MTQEQLDIIRRGIALTIERSSRRFRRLNGLILVGIGAAFIGSVVCLDVWPGFPRWIVYVLAAFLVTHALFHGLPVRWFEECEQRAWEEFLKHVAPGPGSADSARPVPPNNRPVLRVFRPGGET